MMFLQDKVRKQLKSSAEKDNSWIDSHLLARCLYDSTRGEAHRDCKVLVPSGEKLRRSGQEKLQRDDDRERMAAWPTFSSSSSMWMREQTGGGARWWGEDGGLTKVRSIVLCITWTTNRTSNSFLFWLRFFIFLRCMVQILFSTVLTDAFLSDKPRGWIANVSLHPQQRERYGLKTGK